LKEILKDLGYKEEQIEIIWLKFKQNV
jgi:hypothetical protein